jgi:aminoglycoside phosphotransferase (APT) family kinase protein
LISDVRSSPTAEWIAQIRARYPVERAMDDTLTARLRRRAQAHAHQAADLADLNVRLDAFLRKRIGGAFSVRKLAALTGGASKEQFSFELEWSEAGKPRVDLMVLRREPEESVVETNRLREFQVIAAVEGVIPVPKTWWLDATGEELGRPAIIYAFVGGVQKPSSGTSGVTGVGIQFDRAQRAAIGPQFIEYLARIHTFSSKGVDLSAFDVPKVGTTQDIDGQINWWARVWAEDRTEAIPLMTLAEAWLRANRAPLDHCSLVHGDFRTGNYLFDENTLRITAVLDWELAYFGDRHLDLAWILIPTFETRGENGEKLSSSLFPREQFLADYERASGLKVDPQRLAYYTVFCQWRAVVNILGTAVRIAGGGKSHQDIVAAWFAGLGYTMCESLRQALIQAGVDAAR